MSPMWIHHTISFSIFMTLSWSPATPEDEDASTGEYERAIEAVAQATLEVNTNPEQGIAMLREALSALHEHGPELAADPEALELRTMAELTLARALLSQGEDAAATEVVDATLVSLDDAELPTTHLGPTLGELVDERREVLRVGGRGRLQVDCALPCRVFVDEREVSAADGSGATLTTPAGRHRVWIEARDGSVAAQRTELALDGEEGVELSYPLVAEAPAPSLSGGQAEGGQDMLRPPGRHERVAPRWVEVGTIVAGASAIAAGAVLWAIDSRCPRGADPSDIVACPQLYDTRNAGIALSVGGAAALITGGVMLTVDERRVGRARGREVALVWTGKF